MGALEGKFEDTVNSITVVLPRNPSVSPSAACSVVAVPSFPAVASDASPYPVGVTVRSLGGGLYTLAVNSHHETDVAGHAEWWSHKLLTDLGKTGLGNLYAHDQKWEGVMFAGGECGIVRAASTVLVSYSLTFVKSFPKSEDLTDEEVSETPPTIADRNNDADYTFRDIQLGVHAYIDRVTVSRPPLVKYIPRAEGVRVKSRRGGRGVDFGVAAWVRIAPDGAARKRKELEEELHDLAKRCSTIPGTLAGQGNTFEDCSLRTFEVGGGDGWWAESVRLSFEQELEPTGV